MSLWTDGTVSRFDVLVALRLLERKWMRVDAPIWVSADPDLMALGIISPSFSTEEDANLMYTRHAGFSIRVNPYGEFDGDDIEGSILHELTHAGQAERVGNDKQPNTSQWATKNADENGDLDFDGTVAYYGLFDCEREAKENEIRMIFTESNKRYWRAILKEGDRLYR